MSAPSSMSYSDAQECSFARVGKSWPNSSDYTNFYPVVYESAKSLSDPELCDLRDWYHAKSLDGRPMDISQLNSSELIKFSNSVSCVHMLYNDNEDEDESLGDRPIDFLVKIASKRFEDIMGDIPPVRARENYPSYYFKRWFNVLDDCVKMRKPVGCLSAVVSVDQCLYHSESLLLPIQKNGKIVRIIVGSAFRPTGIEKLMTPKDIM